MKRRTPIRQKIFYTVTACAGISLLLWIVMHVGPREILQNLRAFGLAIVLFILLEGVASIFYALATRFCFWARANSPRGHSGRSRSAKGPSHT